MFLICFFIPQLQAETYLTISHFLTLKGVIVKIEQVHHVFQVNSGVSNFHFRPDGGVFVPGSTGM